jgi:hypothetical protein
MLMKVLIVLACVAAAPAAFLSGISLLIRATVGSAPTQLSIRIVGLRLDLPILTLPIPVATAIIVATALLVYSLVRMAPHAG